MLATRCRVAASDVRALSTLRYATGSRPTARDRHRDPGDLPVVAITGDDVVLTARLSVAYGGRPARPQARPPSRSIDAPGRSWAARSLAWSPPTTSAIARSVRRGCAARWAPRRRTSPRRASRRSVSDRGVPSREPLLLLPGNRSDYRWPCRRGWKPIPNHEGYDYLASRLASYGYVVVSVSGNGVNVLGNRVADTGAAAWRADRGPSRPVAEVVDDGRRPVRRPVRRPGRPVAGGHDGAFAGRRGVIWHVIVDRGRPAPYGIDAVLPLAPVDFTRETANGVPLAVMLPYCDGMSPTCRACTCSTTHATGCPEIPRPSRRSRRSGQTTTSSTRCGRRHSASRGHSTTPSAGARGSSPPASSDGSVRRTSCRSSVGTWAARRRSIRSGRARRHPGLGTARALLAYLAPDLRHRLDVDRFTHARSIRRTEQGGPVSTAGLSFVGWCANTFETPRAG